MTDRIVLRNMTFRGRHGIDEGERAEAQPFEVDVELALDLRPAGVADDLTRTVDYRDIFEICRSVVEGPSRRLIEALAETIADRVLERSAGSGATEVVVRVRKPRVLLPGELDGASVEITRRRAL
ncbi:MAG: dihydroneopterin aldolase [Candidatus Limnocylindrales bacterium]